MLTLTLTCFAQGVCRRHREAAGGFSFCLPEGWTAVERPEQKYKIIFGPRGQVFTPNINMKDEVNKAPLADYVAASLKIILSNYGQTGATSVRIMSQANFMTATRIPGIKVTLQAEYKGLLIRTLQYYFSGVQDQKLIVTCTALEEERAALDPVFERVLKTFQRDK